MGWGLVGLGVQVISVSQPGWIGPFTGLSPAQFGKLVRLVAARGGDAIADGRPGRPWSLVLADRVLLVATYWRTNLTLRQIGPLFGVSYSAAYRIVASLQDHLALQPVRRRPADQVCIVDGTLVPTRDRTLADRSKNYRHSANVQVAIDANTRLVVAVGQPTPGSRNDCRAYSESGIDRALEGRVVMADGGYQGTGLIIPYRKRADGHPLPDWQQALNVVHRHVRARVEHALARLKCWKILRDYRRKARTLHATASGIALLHNLSMTG